MRPYTGQHVLRKGWRMQDKRVLPGCSDYYVHDVDGRPILREQAPHHGSLTDFLSPIARILRSGLGEQERIMLAFDRAGAFPERMAELRDLGVEFVTYERRPYPLLAASELGPAVMLDDEPVQIVEAPQRNLRGGRGRVRRIVVRHADGSQVNLLAVSKQPAEWDSSGLQVGRDSVPPGQATDQAVSDPAVNADQRFPLIAVVSVTGTPGDGALYPELSSGKSGLTKTSYALIDHLRSVNKRRIRRVFGRIAKGELAALDQGLELFLGLASEP